MNFEKEIRRHTSAMMEQTQQNKEEEEEKKRNWRKSIEAKAFLELISIMLYLLALFFGGVSNEKEKKLISTYREHCQVVISF